MHSQLIHRSEPNMIATELPVNQHPMTRLTIFRPLRTRLAHVLVLVSFFGALLFASQVQAQEFNFRVWAGEREIGTHRFQIERQGESTNVLSEALYKVKVLFVNVFRYEHTAEEVWNGNCLASLTSSTVENGEKTRIDARLDADRFAVVRNEQPLLETDACVGSYAYWDKQRIQRDALMNAQTGEIDAATVSELGTQPLPRINKATPALQIKTEASNIQLWYSDEGEWLALKAEADDQPIVYLNEELL